jgi:hypothetical protein
MKLINTTTGIVEFFGAQADFEGVEFYDTYLDETGNAVSKNQKYLIELDDTEKQAERKAEQLKGVEFQGVMCSATEADQNGLGVMLTRYIACKISNKPFTPVNFKFANGNSLILTADNIDAFQATWEPFRAQFFPVPEVA